MVTRDSETLSPQQAKILNFIQREISRSGRPPTYRDIAQHFGLGAVGTVQDHVRALVRKGFLEIEKGVARGLQLVNRSRSTDIPILGMVPAGRPIEAAELLLGTVPTLDRYGVDTYALRVKGESMIGAGIMDGDLVVVKKTSDVKNGDIVVALVDGEVTVKYLDRSKGRVRLLPDNPKFEPIEVSGELENWVQGKVVSVQRYYG